MEQNEPISRCGWLPLVGLRVLDFTSLLPGPFVSVTLGDLGAEVIKIEPPGGDFARRMAGPMQAMVNRNKRALALDLKRPACRALVECLARWADIALEGFRPGVAERLGVGPIMLRELNPRLIYCSLSGFGQDGPLRDSPGHDLNYIAASGALTLGGHWAGPPRRSGVPVADLAGASFALVAIVSALHERARTGRGVYLDVALADAALAFTAARHGLEGSAVSRAHLYPTNDVFESDDGASIALGIIEPHFWRGFVAATADLAPDLGRAEWATETGRIADGDALHARIGAVLRSCSAAEWEQRLRQHDVPHQRVLSPAEASRTPQVQARELVMERGGERHLPFPVRADGRRGGQLDSLASPMGADADDILRELGLSLSEIHALHASGALTPETPSP